MNVFHLDTSRDELRVQLSRELIRHCDPQWYPVIRHCVPVLVELMLEQHEQPVEVLSVVVREVIFESCESSERNLIASQIPTVIREMEKMRRAELRSGEWSDLPMTQQWAG